MTANPASPRVIYVGPKAIEDFLVRSRPNWSFIHQRMPDGTERAITSLEQFEQGLGDYSIDNEIDIVVFIDVLFDPSGRNDLFEKSVAYLSQACMLLIVQYKPEYEDLIRQRVSVINSQAGTSGSFYFIPKNSPNTSIDKSIQSFVANPNNDNRIKEVLLGRPTVQPTADTKDAYFTSESSSSYDSIFDDTPKGKIITITSNKGGSGKSTIALSLATYLAHASIKSVEEGLEKKPLKICVADYNVKDGQLGFLTGSITPTMADLIKKGLNTENLRSVIHHNKNLKVDALLAPKLPRFVDMMETHFFAEVLELLRREYDLVIVDTSVEYLDPLLEEVVYPMADQIIFVCDFVIQAIYGMRRWINEVTKPKDPNSPLAGSGIQADKIGIVFNKVLKAGDELSPDLIKKAVAGLAVLSAIPDKRSSVSKASNSQSIDLLLRDPEITLGLKRLSKAIYPPDVYKLSENVA